MSDKDHITLIKRLDGELNQAERVLADAKEAAKVAREQHEEAFILLRRAIHEGPGLFDKQKD